MEPWEHDRLFNTTHSIDAPDEQIPWYDPKDEEDYLVDCYLNDEAYLEAHISSLLGEEVKL